MFELVSLAGPTPHADTAGAQKRSRSKQQVTGHNNNDNSAADTDWSTHTETAVTIIDMGIHKVQGLAEPLLLVQVMPPGLEARAQCFPAFNTVQQKTPGYFDAPATLKSPLPVRGCDIDWKTVALPEVTLVFCAVENYNQMLKSSRWVCGHQGGCC